MTIIVTGATGHLGRLTVECLLAKGVAVADIVAAGRNTDALAELTTMGVRTARIDYGDQVTLRRAFADADAVLLISGNEPGHRVQQHGNVIQAAKEAGVGHLVYTSVTKASTTTAMMAPEHKATEEIIAASGLPSTILRNGMYTENYLFTREQARATGVIVASVGDGRVASASRKDFAEAAAVVLTEKGDHLGKVYELSGDVAWNYHELASTIADIVGRQVVYNPVRPEEYLPILAEYGLDENMAGFVVALDGDTRAGLSAETPGELSALIGRPTTPLARGLSDPSAAPGFSMELLRRMPRPGEQ
jgi:NAD(P)H dehydrogenase (quinone)